MFGHQGVIPGITDGNPATMEPVTVSDAFRNEFVNRQKSEEMYRLIDKFTFGKIEIEKFKFTGLNVQQTGEGILVDQNKYIQSIKPIKVDKVADKNAKLSVDKNETRIRTNQSRNRVHVSILE